MSKNTGLTLRSSLLILSVCHPLGMLCSIPLPSYCSLQFSRSRALPCNELVVPHLTLFYFESLMSNRPRAVLHWSDAISMIFTQIRSYTLLK